MKVRVEGTYGPSSGFRYRLTLPDGRRTSLPGDDWTRELASRALDEVQRLTGARRGSIRFDHC